jgi:hypothetical protein
MPKDLIERVLQELRALRNGQEALRRGQESVLADLVDVKVCPPDESPGFVMSQMAYLQLQIASQTSRIDRFDQRLGRIERQIETIPAL